MGFIRAGLRASKYLKEYTDSFIALQFAGIVPNQRTEFEDGTTVVRDVVRARIISLSPDGTKGAYDGELLVHQSVLAQELNSRPNDWMLGVLEEQEHSTDKARTVFVMTPPEGGAEAFKAAEATITAMGLA